MSLIFVLAEKKPDAAKYQISEVMIIIRKIRKCKLHEMLKKVAAEGADPLAVELAAKLSYASFISADEAKHHRDCMQRFLSGITVTPGLIRYKLFVNSKSDGFNNFCDWYEYASHDALFEVQKHIEDNNNKELSDQTS